MIIQSGTMEQVYGMSQRIKEAMSPKMTESIVSLASDFSFLCLEMSQISPSMTRNMIRATPIQRSPGKSNPRKAAANCEIRESEEVAVRESSSVPSSDPAPEVPEVALVSRVALDISFA